MLRVDTMMLAVQDATGRAIALFYPLYDDDPAIRLPGELDLEDTDWVPVFADAWASCTDP